VVNTFIAGSPFVIDSSFATHAEPNREFGCVTVCLVIVQPRSAKPVGRSGSGKLIRYYYTAKEADLPLFAGITIGCGIKRLSPEITRIARKRTIVQAEPLQPLPLAKAI
ncbi:MAG: hypothetical protein ACK57U_03400, partial [Planctomycetota bacterium]